MSHSAFTPLKSKNNSDSKQSSKEIPYSNFLSPTQALNQKESLQDFKHPKEDKFYNFSISGEKSSYKRNSPTPNKKELKFIGSGAKINQEDVTDGILNNHLFSQDLGEDENDKSPFSFLNKPNPVTTMQNNKNFQPKVLNYDQLKAQNLSNNS